MRKIINIAWKDTLVRFSSRSEFLFFLILPIFFIFLLGGGIVTGSETEDRIPLLVVDKDGSQLSADLLSLISSTETLEIRTLALAEAETLFEDGQAPALLIIPSSFEEDLSQGLSVVLGFSKAPENNDALVAEQTILSSSMGISRAIAVGNLTVAELEQRQQLADSAQKKALFTQSMRMARSLFASSPERVEVTLPEEAREDSYDGYSPAAQATTGQLITWVFIPLLGTSSILAYERQMGTLRRLLSSPTSTSTYLLGTVLGQLAQVGVQMAILVLFGAIVMGVYWGQSPAALVVLLTSFALASVAFGILLGAFVKTDGQASSLSIMSGMAMALLGGCWYPMEIFPPVAQEVVKVLPTTWAMQGLTDLTMRGKGLPDILPAAGVLLAFAAVFFAVGIKRFRYE